MAANIEKVLVIGMGKVGSLVGTLLHETGFQVTKEAKSLAVVPLPTDEE